MKRSQVTAMVFVALWPVLSVGAAERAKPPSAEKSKPPHTETAKPPSTVKAEPAGTKVRFEIFSGYAVSNKFEPNAAESCLFVEDQRDFDRVFEVDKASKEKPHHLSKDAFKSEVVLAVVKRGKSSWEFRVDGVTEANGIVELHFTTVAKATNLATASALIVGISKGHFGAIHFVEDKRLVKVVDIKKR